MTITQFDATHRLLRDRIRDTYWKKTKPKKGQARITFGEGLRRTIERRSRKPKLISSDINIWLMFFDEALGFWLLVWVLYRQALEKEKPVSKRSMCLTALSGRVFQDMVCVREMIRSGFFVQSNVVTRSLIEAIDVMHLINARPELADAFRSVETNEDASKFWHTYCSREKMHKQIKERWYWFFQKSAEMADTFHSRRNDYLDLLGMSAHPSFAASFSSFMDRPKGQRPQKIVYNAMGSVSQMSKFTMHLILLRVFEYGLLWVGPEANLYKGVKGAKPPRFKKELLRCLNIVFSIVYSVDQDRGPNAFFPEFKTYWPRSNFK
jgi:hypothetical protein